MKIVIVYDSFFGNIREIAIAIHRALSEHHQADIRSVNEVNPELAASADLLFVGTPTRSFRPTPAITQLLKAIPKNALTGKSVAAFDTRVKLDDINSKPLRFMVKAGSYAAKLILKLLQKKGGNSVGIPDGFFVKGEEGPLYEEETGRAMRWVSQLITDISAEK